MPTEPASALAERVYMLYGSPRAAQLIESDRAAVREPLERRNRELETLVCDEREVILQQRERIASLEAQLATARVALRGTLDGTGQRVAALESAARSLLDALYKADGDVSYGSRAGNAIEALEALLPPPEPTTVATPKDSDVIESHEPFDPRLEDAGLRWVRYPSSWDLGWSGVATVWPNGVWHTWDARGTGGENASELDVEKAKRAAEAALFRQDAHPIKGWRSHGFDQLELDPDDDEPTAASGEDGER